MAWADKTRHKMLSAVSTVLVFYTKMISVVQTNTQAKRHHTPLDVAWLTLSLSSSPAIVRNASILNLCVHLLVWVLSNYKVNKYTPSFMYTSFKGLTFIKKKNVDIYAHVDANDQLYEQEISLQQPSPYFASIK